MHKYLYPIEILTNMIYSIWDSKDSAEINLSTVSAGHLLYTLCQKSYATISFPGCPGEKEGTRVSLGSKGEAKDRWKGQNCYPLVEYKFSWWQWLFLSTNCGAANTAEGVLVFYGAGSIYGPPLRRGREPRGFSGIAVWQTADVLYTRASPSSTLPSPFPSPSLSFSCPLRNVPSFIRHLSLFYGLIVHPRSLHGCVYHKASIVERPNDTHRYVSFSFSPSSSSSSSSSMQAFHQIYTKIRFTRDAPRETCFPVLRS